MNLSKPARELLRRRANGEHVEVASDNLQAYRKLVRAGVMYPLSGFMVGPEAAFRFTEYGWNCREELQRLPLYALSHSAKDSADVLANRKFSIRHELNHVIVMHAAAFQFLVGNGRVDAVTEAHLRPGCGSFRTNNLGIQLWVEDA